MDSAKAKQAVEKATQAKQMAALMAAAPIDPEIQAPMATLQPEDGYINPYHPLGTVPSTPFSPGNMIDGSMDPRARAVERTLMP